MYKPLQGMSQSTYDVDRPSVNVFPKKMSRSVSAKRISLEKDESTNRSILPCALESYTSMAAAERLSPRKLRQFNSVKGKAIPLQSSVCNPLRAAQQEFGSKDNHSNGIDLLLGQIEGVLMETKERNGEISDHTMDTIDSTHPSDDLDGSHGSKITHGECMPNTVDRNTIWVHCESSPLPHLELDTSLPTRGLVDDTMIRPRHNLLLSQESFLSRRIRTRRRRRL